MICRNSFASSSATCLGLSDLLQYPSNISGSAACNLSICFLPIARLTLSASEPDNPHMSCKNLMTSSWNTRNPLLSLSSSSISSDGLWFVSWLNNLSLYDSPLGLMAALTSDIWLSMVGLKFCKHLNA